MILVTGCAGFIGYHLSKNLLEKKCKIIGIDNNNSYYDSSLKKKRLKELKKFKHFKFYLIDISNQKSLEKIFLKYKFDLVVNLAAQAGVRYSFDNPEDYLNSNIIGFFNVINLSKIYKVKKFIYASSSSVYGNNTLPYNEKQNIDKPLNFYAQTKITNELMAKTYFNIYGFRSVGLRFFTVYGPWGRPDMAYYKFTKSIFEGRSIHLHNNGSHLRDFTYIDDIIDGINLLVDSDFKKFEADVFNIGSGKSYDLISFINIIEKIINKKAILKYLPMQSGEALETRADISKLKKMFNYQVKFNLENGLQNFVEWYKKYYLKK